MYLDWRGKCVLAFAALYFAAGFLWLSFGLHKTIPGETAALMFPPHWTDDQMLAAALDMDLDLLGFGRFENILLVVPRSSQSFVNSAQAGVVMVLNAAGAAICR